MAKPPKASSQESFDDPYPGAPSPEMAQPWLPATLALLVPGAGHLILKRWPRGLLFGGLVFSFVFLGVDLDGQLQTGFQGPLQTLGTLASMGIGITYGILRFVLGYQGDISAAGFEYGSTFLITAGLMNLLVTLDAWDIAHGRKD